MLGLGVWQVRTGPDRVDAVRWALELGYRHIDTAQAYGNEESVGQGTAREWSATRGGVHHHEVLSRAPGPGRGGRTEPSTARVSSMSISTSSIGPRAARPGPGRGWSARSSSGMPARLGFPISASATCSKFLRPRRSRPRLSTRSSSAPYLPPRLARSKPGAPGCRSKPTAPLAPAGTCQTPPSRRIATVTGARPRRYCCAGASSIDLPVLPKSTHRERIEENAQIFDFRLSDEEMAELDALDRTGGTDRALEHRWWRG